MRRTLVSALLAGLLSAGPARAAEGGPVIGAVVVEGTRRVEVDAVKAAVSAKPGGRLDEAALDADLRAVMKLGYFADAAVELRGDAARPEVVFRVAEKPSVSEVKIEGNEEISKEDLKDTLAEIKTFSILDVAGVRRTVKKIQEKYVEKGFYLAEVSHRLEDQPDNQVVVVVVVNERAKVQVKRIAFIGNANVPREDLLAFMQTQEGGLLSFLGSGGTYKEEAFQQDLQAIQFVYNDRGYVTAKVQKPYVALSPDKRFLYITLRVEEGEKYTVGKIDFSGDLLFPKEKLHALVKVRSGEVFARSKVGKDLFAVQDVYRDAGYAYVNVNPLTDLNPKTRILDVTYDVQPGQKVSFERIDIVGNQKTRDKVIRRELRIFEGELYSQTGINVSKQRVNALGFFEKVEVTTSRGSADDRMVAKVEVKERSTGQFQVGAGFSSYENFILTGQISQNNFFGWGTTLSLQVQWSSVRQLGQIQWVDPYFLDTRWTFAFDLYAQEGLYTTFTRRSLGGSMTWGYELAGLSQWWTPARRLEDVRLFATYTNEFVRVTQSGSQVVLADFYKSGTTSSVRLALQVDRRDNRITPNAGHYLSLSAEAAPPFLAPEALFGQNVNLFTRYNLDARYYQPVWFGLVGRARLNAGYIAPWRSNQTVPVSERFFLGGINSVRGYRIFSIAPEQLVPAVRDPTSPTTPLAVGGNKQLILNLELELPIVDKMGIRGVVFYDLGNAYEAGRPLDPTRVLTSWGFGLRWFSPLGPLRFEWGFPLDRRRDKRTGEYTDQALDFQFTIGSFF